MYTNLTLLFQVLCHVKILQVIYEKFVKSVNHFIQNAVTECKQYTLNVYQNLLENVVR